MITSRVMSTCGSVQEPEGRAGCPQPYLYSAMVGTARCAVSARVVAGGTNMRATLAIERVTPLHAARTSQRDVPTTLNRYPQPAGAGTESVENIEHRTSNIEHRRGRKARPDWMLEVGSWMLDVLPCPQ